MKPTYHLKNFTFSTFNLKPLCEDLKNGLWRYVSPSLSSPPDLRLWGLLTHHVIRGCLAGKTRVSVAFNELLSNRRAFVGFVMLVGVAPLLYWAHLFFINTKIPHLFAFITDPYQAKWFYHHNYYWLFTNREELGFGFALSGFFLLCQQKWGYRFLLVPLVAGCLSEVIYQSLQIDHWSDFYTPIWSKVRSWQIAAFAIPAMYATWKAIDYTIYRKYHLSDGNVARIIGMIKAPGISAERKITILEDLVKESENFNERV